MNKKAVGGALIAVGIICIPIIWFFVAFAMSLKRGDDRARQIWADQASGKFDFGDHPDLFPVAQAIAANDQDAIRTTGRALPDLNAPGREGKTLLSFAVTRSWQHPEMVAAVKTLLALGIDPNYTNAQPNSYAMAAAVHGPAPVLQAMLDAGGNSNARDQFGQPLICLIWYLGYYKNHERARFDLLLERGADVNSTMPPDRDDGYTVLLYRTQMGLKDPLAYADALTLLQRGADPNRPGADGMTFAKMLTEHRALVSRHGGGPPPQFTALWDWAVQHGIVAAIGN